MVKLYSIPGFSAYAVSKDGRVWRKCLGGIPDKGRRCRNYPFELTPQQNKLSYLNILLTGDDGKRVRFRVNRLVLSVFKGACSLPLEASHKNGIRWDNRLANLRWATKKENAADKNRHGTMARGEKNGQAKLSAENVTEIRVLLASKTLSQTQISKKFGVKQAAISNIFTGRKWKAV